MIQSLAFHWVSTTNRCIVPETFFLYWLLWIQIFIRPFHTFYIRPFFQTMSAEDFKQVDKSVQKTLKSNYDYINDHQNSCRKPSCLFLRLSTKHSCIQKLPMARAKHKLIHFGMKKNIAESHPLISSPIFHLILGFLTNSSED